MIMLVIVTRWGREDGLKLPFLSVGREQQLGDLDALALHEDPVSTCAIAVGEVELGNPCVGEAHTPVGGADDDPELERAISITGLGRELVFALTPAPFGTYSLITVDCAISPLCHLEVGGIVRGEDDDGDILDGDGVRGALLISQPACHEASLLATQEPDIEGSIRIGVGVNLEHDADVFTELVRGDVGPGLCC